jgi:phosphoribosylglycinamide formyltransferase-1
VIRIAVLASHGGSILQAIVDACETGELEAAIALVISNNSGSRALERARAHGIAAIHLSSQTHPEPELLDRAMCAALEHAAVDWVVLAGYMKKLGPTTLATWRHRIINTHPSLLPRFGGRGFYGRRVHEAVLQAGDPETGATVHLVEAEYDQGPALSQVRVPVHSDDTPESLEQRVLIAERKLMIHTLMALSSRREASGY